MTYIPLALVLSIDPIEPPTWEQIEPVLRIGYENELVRLLAEEMEAL